ncbi:MAG: radical SAM protein [Firmicutes bacterium]|nr:radical SAM protein [Bacillota bacterium]
MSDFPFKPEVVGWELTLRCNMNCIHCGSTAGEPRPNELTEKEGLDLIDQMAELGTKILTLSGGEPLMHPSWHIYAKKLVEKGIAAYIITNGLLLEAAIPKMLEAGMRRIGVSIDGMEKTHNFIRNHPNSFQIAMKGIKKAIENGIAAGAITHISKANIGEMEDMYQHFLKVGLSFWQIQITFSQGRMKTHDDYALDPQQMLDIADFIYKKQQEGKMQVVPGDNMGYYCEPPITKRPFKGCFAGRHLMGVDADGSIKGCLSLPREFVEGNIRTESLRTIWEDPQRFKYNRYFSTDMLEGYCKDCPKGDPCRGGCTVTAYAATGSKFNNPYCVYRVMREKQV